MLGPVEAFDAIGLTLAANDDEIVGRTTMQKLIYFETVKIPEIKLAEPYTPYYYGPFNKDIAMSLEQMVVFDILEERRTRYGYGSYVYKVAEKGIPIIEKLLNNFEKTFTKIEKLVDTCYEYCKLDPNSLSFAAKVHYMLNTQKTKKKTSRDELMKLGKSLQWNISRSDINDGAELLEQLHLVKINR